MTHRGSAKAVPIRLRQPASVTCIVTDVLNMRTNYEPLENERDFEFLCLKLLRVHLGCPTLELYGRRGEKQHGVDIIDLGGSMPLRAAQCKLHQHGKTLTATEIEEEVNKAKGFEEPIGVYAILTTARVSTEAQNTIRKLNRKHKEQGLFHIEPYFWDQINVLLNEYPQVADEFYDTVHGHQLVAVIKEVTSTRIAVEALTESKGGEGFDSEIDLAKQHIERHETQMARLILQRLRSRHWDKLDARQKFRVLSNIGAAYLMEGDLKNAAELFWEAKPYQPDDEKASANEALGYEVTGSKEKAFELADQYRNRFPTSTRLVALWVRNAPAHTKMETLEAQVPEHLTNDAEVAAAFAIRASNENDFAKAEKYARKAVASKVDWAFARMLLGKVIIRSSANESFDVHGEAEISSEEPRIREAERLCTEAIALAQQERANEILAEAHNARSLIRKQLGDQDGASSDAAEAYRRLPNDPLILREYALVLSGENRTNEAVDILRKVVALHDDHASRYLLAMTLRQRNKPGDWDEAIEILAKIAKSPETLPSGFREHIADTCVDLLCRLQRWKEAESLVEDIPFGRLSHILSATLKGIISWKQQDQEKTFKSAEQALSGLAPDTPPNERRMLARLLTACGRHSEALELWKSLTELTRFDDDAFNFLESARRLGRGDLILDGCRRLREAGVESEQVVDLELAVLEKYDVERAIVLLQGYLACHPQAKFMRLRLSLIGMRLNRNELVATDPALLPSLEEVSPEAGCAVVQVLKMGGRPDEATEFAYQLLRKHFSEVDAHRAFCLCLHPFGPKPTIQTPSIVEPGVAVCFQETGEASESWVIIEDQPNPDLSRSEISPDSHIARHLYGKRIGETAVFAEGQVSKRTAVVKDIVSKYVFRYRDCMNQWQLRFPDTPEVEVVRVKPDPNSEALDLSALLASVDRRAERVEKVKEVYRSTPVTIHMFGAPFGNNAFQATVALATAPDTKINCCVGSADEEVAALEALKNANTVIVDLSALATLAMLDGLRFITAWPKELAVSQATIGELHELLRRERLTTGDGAGVLSKVDGRYALYEDTNASQTARIQKLEKFIGEVTRRCKVVGCLALASLESDKRLTLVKGCGQYGAESMLLASAPGTVLWTDDHTLARVAKGEFGARRVWTQVVLQSLTLSGQIEAKIFFEASARLLGWGYTFTSPSAPALEQAGVLASWNPGERPLKQALEIFCDVSLSLIDSLRLAAAFLVVVYSGRHLPETERVVAAAMLEKLARRQGGMKGIRALVEALPRLLGVNVIGCQKAQDDIRAWLKHAAGQHPEII